jgi:hypothetical protein
MVCRRPLFKWSLVCVSRLSPKCAQREISNGFRAGSYLVFKPQLCSQLRVSAAPREFLFIRMPPLPILFRSKKCPGRVLFRVPLWRDDKTGARVSGQPDHRR